MLCTLYSFKENTKYQVTQVSVMYLVTMSSIREQKVVRYSSVVGPRQNSSEASKSRNVQ